MPSGLAGVSRPQPAGLTASVTLAASKSRGWRRISPPSGPVGPASRRVDGRSTLGSSRRRSAAARVERDAPV